MTGLVNFAHIYNAQKHYVSVQFGQVKTASWFKSIQAGTLYLKNYYKHIYPENNDPVVQVAFLAQKTGHYRFKLHH